NGTVDLVAKTYEVVALTSVGSVSGRITRAGGLPNPADSTRDTAAAAIQYAETTEVKCTAPSKARQSRHARGKKADASESSTNQALPVVVWIGGVRKGKPLSDDKRADLSSEDCSIDPRVQAVSAGTTFNVDNDDKALHTLVFTTKNGHDTLTRMPFFNR